MLSNSCIYLQLEAQKASIMTALAEHIKKELLKITQITTLQNTLHPNHSSSSCPNCHLLRANPFGQNLLELTAMQAMSSSINDLKSSMAELSKLIPYNSPSQTPSICSESLETKELSNSLTSATKINQNQDIIVKDEDDGQESNDTSNDQSLKSVPKIDKMRHMGFKPQSSSQVNTSNKTQKKVIYHY